MRSNHAVNRKLVGRYEEWMVALHYAAHTKAYHEKVVNLFTQFVGKRLITAVTPSDVRRFIARISQDGRTPSTCYRYLSVIRQFYDFLNLGGVVSYVAPRFVKLPRIHRNDFPILSQSQVRRLIAATRTKRERALIEFYYSTGCRLREATHLRVEDIDLVSRTVHIRGKGGKRRVVFLTESAIDALKAYLGNRETGYVFQEDRPPQKASLTNARGYWVGVWADYNDSTGCLRRRKFLGKVNEVSYEEARQKLDQLLEGAKLKRPLPDRPLTNTLISSLLVYVGLRAGLKNIGSHMLRRTFASHMYDNGVSLEVLKTLLGHRWVHTTLGYTRISPTRLEQSFDECHPGGKFHDQATKQYRPDPEAWKTTRPIGPLYRR